MFVLWFMSSKKPDRTTIIDRQFPVRLRVAVRGARGDWHNEQTRAALLRIAGEGNFGTTPSVLWSAEPRTVHLHLPNLYVAQSLLLACPHLELIGEEYAGPWR